MRKKFLLIHHQGLCLILDILLDMHSKSINKYRSNLTHGEAISIGMILSAKISYKMKNIQKIMNLMIS